MDDVHSFRHQLRNKRASKSTTAAYNFCPAEIETPFEVHQRHKALQAGHQTNGQATRKSNTRPQCLRGFELGRMFNDKKVITILGTAINYGSRTQAT